MIIIKGWSLQQNGEVYILMYHLFQLLQYFNTQLLAMNFTEPTLNIQNTLFSFLNHKEFDAYGNKKFKELQKTIIQYSHDPQSLNTWINILQTSSQEKTLVLASLLMKDKFKYEFDQLQTNLVSSMFQHLKDLINHKFNGHKTPKIILANISYCIVYTYMNYSEEFGGVQNFLKKYFEVENHLYLFKFLQLLPQQARNERFVISEESRKKVREILIEQQVDVIIKLHQYYKTQLSNGQDTNIPLLSILLNSFSNWLQVDTNSSIYQNLQQHILLKMTFEHLSNPFLNESALKCLLSIISHLKPTLNGNENLFMYVGQNVFKLLQQIPNLHSQKEYETMEIYLRILCDFGNKATYTFIAKYDHNVREYLLKMVQFINCKEVDVYYRLIDFWETFFFALSKKQHQFMIESEIVEKLVYELCKKIRYTKRMIKDLDQISEYNYKKMNLEMEIQERINYREGVDHVFKGIGTVIGQQNYVMLIQKFIANTKSDEDAEAYLFSLIKVVRDYPKASNEICQLVGLFQQLISPYLIIKKQFLRIFSSLFTIKEKNANFLKDLFKYVSEMLSIKILADQAGKALAIGCKQNKDFIMNFIEQFIGLLQRYPQEKSVLEGIISVLNSKPQLLKKYLPQIIKPTLSDISRLITKKQYNFNSLKATFLYLQKIVESLAMGNYEITEQIIVYLMKQIWPTFKQILQDPVSQSQPSQSKYIIERVVKIIKVMMRKIPHKFLQFISPIFQCAIKSYEKYPISTYLYLFQITVTVYGEYDVNVIDYLKLIYNKMYSITFMYFSSSNDPFSDYEYLVYDFLGANLRIMVYNADIIFDSDKLKPMIQFCVQCLISDIPCLLSSACQLFQSIFMVNWKEYSRKKYQNSEKGEVVKIKEQNRGKYTEMKEILKPLIPSMLQKLVYTLSQGPSQLCRNTTLDCINAAILAYPECNCQNWQGVLSKLSEDILTKVEKQAFLSYLQKLNTDDHPQFLTAELKVTKYIEMIANRFLNKIRRQKSLEFYS